MVIFTSIFLFSESIGNFLFLPSGIDVYIDGNCLIFLLVQTPSEPNKTGIYPVLDLVDVGQIVQVRVVHSPLVLEESQTNFNGEENREDSGTSQHWPWKKSILVYCSAFLFKLRNKKMDKVWSLTRSWRRSIERCSEWFESNN